MCVEDGGVIAATEARADRREALLGELARQVHRHLAGERDSGPTIVGEECLARETELRSCRLLDGFERAACRRAEWIQRLEDVAGELGGGVGARDRGKGHHS